MSFLWVFFIWKKYSKSKQTKYSGFVKLGVRWSERDIGYIFLLEVCVKVISVCRGDSKAVWKKLSKVHSYFSSIVWKEIVLKSGKAENQWFTRITIFYPSPSHYF